MVSSGKRIDRYADYEFMDEYPMLLSSGYAPYCDYEHLDVRTPLQELADRVFASHDPTDPPLTFDFVASPSIVSCYPSTK